MSIVKLPIKNFCIKINDKKTLCLVLLLVVFAKKVRG